MELREEVAREIDKEAGGKIYSLLEYGPTSENHDAFETAADAAIAIVLRKVEQHLSAVQYDPAPYTALKHRLAGLKARKADNG